jgi:hypothetical protein
MASPWTIQVALAMPTSSELWVTLINVMCYATAVPVNLVNTPQELADEMRGCSVRYDLPRPRPRSNEAWRFVGRPDSARACATPKTKSASSKRMPLSAVSTMLFRVAWRAWQMVLVLEGEKNDSAIAGAAIADLAVVTMTRLGKDKPGLVCVGQVKGAGNTPRGDDASAVVHLPTLTKHAQNQPNMRDDVVLVLHTSGSTGKKKQVRAARSVCRRRRSGGPGRPATPQQPHSYAHRQPTECA